jgi:hypothetical protein
MGKEEFHCLCGVMQGWFSAKLGLKIIVMDPIAVSKTSVATDSPGETKGTNHSYSSIWIQQTPLYGQGRVSLALWCHAGLIFSKTWLENQWWTPAVQNFCGHWQPRGNNWNQPLLLFHMDPTNTIVWARKSFIGPVVSYRVDFQQNLAWKSVMDPSSQQNFCGYFIFLIRIEPMP